MRKLTGRLTLIFLVSLLVACSSPEPSSESSSETTDCTSLEPENPYSPGTGHYAGYEWAENNDAGSCGGDSQSFSEGCEEYLRQNAAYEECQSRR